MPHDCRIKVLRGRLQRLLSSPTGGLEGLLITAGRRTLQVSMAPASAVLGASLVEAREVEARGVNRVKIE